MVPQAAAGPESGPVMPMVISVSVTPGHRGRAGLAADEEEGEECCREDPERHGHLHCGGFEFFAAPAGGRRPEDVITAGLPEHCAVRR